MLANELQDKLVDHLIATIEAASNTSDVVKLFGTTMVAFKTPSFLNSTIFTFLGSIDKGETFAPIRDEFDNIISHIVSASGSYGTDPKIFVPYDEIQIVSNVNEGGSRIILIKPFAI